MDPNTQAPSFRPPHLLRVLAGDCDSEGVTRSDFGPAGQLLQAARLVTPSARTHFTGPDVALTGVPSPAPRKCASRRVRTENRRDPCGPHRATHATALAATSSRVVLAFPDRRPDHAPLIRHDASPLRLPGRAVVTPVPVPRGLRSRRRPCDKPSRAAHPDYPCGLPFRADPPGCATAPVRIGVSWRQQGSGSLLRSPLVGSAAVACATFTAASP